MLDNLLSATVLASGVSGTARAITVLVILLWLATVVAMLARRLKAPYTVLLVLAGVGLRVLSDRYEPIEALTHLNLTADLVLFVMLPVLLFESAFNLDSRRLFRNLVPILTLAVPALLLSTALVGGLMFAATRGLGVSAAVALLFGALISATDPVAVIAIFKELGAPKRLTILVEGESLFNDATGFVVFATILGIIETGAGVTGSGVAAAVLEFGRVFAGGLVVGTAFGLLATYTLARLDDAHIETLILTVLALVTFLVAERELHVSGVMAVVAAGVTVGNFGRTKITQGALPGIEEHWEYLAFVTNSVLFLLVGFTVHLGQIREFAFEIAAAFLACLAVRAGLVFGLVPLVNRVTAGRPIDRRFQTIIWWGGLRGAMALAMALLAQPVLERAEVIEQHGAAAGPFVLTVTLGVVLLTIVVPGLTINRLLEWLGFNRLSDEERAEHRLAALLAPQRARQRIRDLRDRGLVGRLVANAFDAQFAEQEHAAREQLEDLPSAADTRALGHATLARHLLMLERAIYLDLYERGDLAEDILRDLHYGLDMALDRLAEGQPPFGGAVTGSRSTTDRAFDSVVALLSKIRPAQLLVQRFRTARLARVYAEAEAIVRALLRLRVELSNLHDADVLLPGAFRAAGQWLARRRGQTRRQIAEIAAVFPEFAVSVERELAARAGIRAQVELLDELTNAGRLTAKAGADLRRDLAGALQDSHRRMTEAAVVRPESVLREVPLFQDLDATGLARIAGVLQPVSFLRNDVIVREGEVGNSLFLIARGEVEVTKSLPDGEEQHLARLGPGDFFGEIAVLTRAPRMASVRALTPCGLLELRRADLRTVTVDCPAVQAALERAHRERVLGAVIVATPESAALDAHDATFIADAMTETKTEAGDQGRAPVSPSNRE